MINNGFLNSLVIKISTGKILGISALTYVLLNFVFMVLYGIVGLGNAFGEFFGLIGDDIGGFFTALLSPGGVEADVFGGMHAGIRALDGGVAQGIFAMCWVLLPGLTASLIAGLKLSQESSKNAFLGVFVSILVLTSLTLIFAAVLAPNGGSMTTAFCPTGFQDVSGVMGYLFVPFVGLFNGLFFGGIAAASSSSL